MKTHQFHDLKLNDSEAFNVIITEKMMADFCLISGDNNPLHVDEAYAIENGFENRVVYGLLVSSFYSRLVGRHLPGKHALLHGIDIAFKKPVYVGDCLTVYGEITHLNAAYQQIEVQATITNQENLVVSKAKIKVGLHG